MLPHAYELPAAIVLVIGGALACFAGYRLFKLVLALYGFILGAMLASSMFGISNTIGMIAAAVVGGVAGALILVFAYFVGIALVGAGLGALLGHIGWTTTQAGDPPALLIIGLAVVGAVAAMVLQRYVIIFSTAFGGAWRLRTSARRRPKRRAATCGFFIRRWIADGVGRCSSGSRSDCSAPECSWESQGERSRNLELGT